MCICINGLMFYLLNTYTALHFRLMAIGGGSEFVEDPGEIPESPNPGDPLGDRGEAGKIIPKSPGLRDGQNPSPLHH